MTIWIITVGDLWSSRNKQTFKVGNQQGQSPRVRSMYLI